MKFAVEYISGYLGFGVNKIEREYCENEQKAYEYAEELKNKNYIGVKVIRTI